MDAKVRGDVLQHNLHEQLAHEIAIAMFSRLRYMLCGAARKPLGMLQLQQLLP